jgi:hypothetical protein
MRITQQLERLKQLQREDGKQVREITVCFKSMSCTHDVVVPVEDFTPRYTAGVYIHSCGEPSLEQWEDYQREKQSAPAAVVHEAVDLPAPSSAQNDVKSSASDAANSVKDDVKKLISARATTPSRPAEETRIPVRASETRRGAQSSSPQRPVRKGAR